MAQNDYEVSGHILLPYNKQTEMVFFNHPKDKKYTLYDPKGIKLENRTGFTLAFIKNHLIPIGYRIEPFETSNVVPKKRIDGISVSTTKVKEGRKIKEILVAIHGKDMRSVIKNCDHIVSFLETTTTIKIKNDAKLWTKQEAC